jgi:hypothetical protein
MCFIMLGNAQKLLFFERKQMITISKRVALLNEVDICIMSERERGGDPHQHMFAGAAIKT